MDAFGKLQGELKTRGAPLVALETSVVLLNNVFAFAANLLTLVVLLRSPRLKTIPNKFVISLAFSDIFMAISSGFFSTQVLIYGKWPFDRVACQFQGYFGHALAAASSQTLALLSLNRYYRIVKPNTYRRIFTTSRTSTMIFSVWAIACLTQLLYAVLGNEYFFHPGKIYCNQDTRKLFTMIYIALYGCITMIVISLCSFKIFLHVREHSRRIFSHAQSAHTVNIEDIKISRILLAMVLTYAVCITPLTVVESIDFLAGGSYLPRQVYFFYTISASISASVNPVIYGVMNRNFRKECKRLFRLNRILVKARPVVTRQTAYNRSNIFTSPTRNDKTAVGKLNKQTHVRDKTKP